MLQKAMTHQILRALENFEKREGGAETHRFWIRQPWMARRLFLSSIVPGFSAADAIRLILGGLTGKTEWLSTRAEAIQLKHDMNRIRVFYLPQQGKPGHCLKIVSISSGIADRVRSEIELRRKLEEYNTVNIPKIIAVHEDEHFLYLKEEMLIGRRFDMRCDAEKFIFQALPQLIETYKRRGIRSEPVGRHIPSDLFQKVSGHAAGRKDFLESLEKVRQKDPIVPIGICQGDLLPSNLCVVGEKLYVIDWDRNFEGPVMFDFLRLPFKSPTPRCPVTESIFQAVQNHFSCTEEDILMQATAYTALRIFQNPERVQEFLRWWRRFARKS